jgi:hypothetical protein
LGTSDAAQRLTVRVLGTNRMKVDAGSRKVTKVI